MYRKNDEKIFITFSLFANILIFAALVLTLLYHFYNGEVLYRDLCIMAIALSVFCKFQILLLKTFVLECRVANLMNVGKRPGKLVLGMGNVAMIIYSVIFWFTVTGAMLAFLPADWRPKFY